MARLVDLPRDVSRLKLSHGFFEDFNEGVVTADRWTLVTSNDGAVSLDDTATEAGGAAKIISAVNDSGTNGDESGILHSTSKAFLFADDKPLVFGARIKFTEAATDDANVFIGVSNVIAAGLMRDGGAGPALTNDAVGFYKVDGGTNWNTHVSFASLPSNTQLSAANSLTGVAQGSGGGTDQLLELECLPVTSTEMDINYKIDGAHVFTESSVTMTDPASMSVVLLIMDGSASSIETLYCDYVYCYQTR